MSYLPSRLRNTLVLIFLSCTAFSQGFTFNCTKDTTINACNNSQCLTLNAIIPDIHANTSAYVVNPTFGQSSCFLVYSQPDDPAGTPSSLVIDDKYSTVIPIGFSFPFYDSVYTSLIASTNGLVSFDITKATAFSHFAILNSGGTLSASTGTPQDLPSALYDKAIIMGPYHDLDPSPTITTSPTKRIQYITVGTAPHRKWILSFYKVPLFQASCNALIENTHQIIIYESTGIIEVTVFSKQICTTWNQGRAMIGIQNYNRNQAVVVPNRAASSAPWGSVGMNESYRFTPSAGASLFKRVELLDNAGNLVATGTAGTASNGQMPVSFPNVCPPPGTTNYIIRSVYKKIDDTTQEIFGSDTVRVTRSSATNLNATSSMTPAACGPNGTVTANVPANMGTAPFSYALDGGAPVNSPNRTYTFSNLNSGAHTVVVTDASGCSSTLSIPVSQSGVLSVTASVIPTACPGSSSGSVTITPQNGTGPFEYALFPNPFQSSNTFTGLSANIYLISVKDLGSGCLLNNYQVQVFNGNGLAATYTANPPSCAGASNGSLTITPSSGLPPFTYSINGGTTYQNSNVFPNLATGSYLIHVKDAGGCTLSNLPASVPASTGSLTATVAATGTSCSGVNNGSITITPTSGSGPYQYSLDAGATWQTGTLISNLSPNSYAVIVKDASGCTSSSIPVTVAQGGALLATMTSVATSCSGVSNGSITVTPSNGAAPYTYRLDGGTAQGSNVFTNVSSGAHTITVTDGAGCISAALPVTVAVGPAITGTTAATVASCASANNGTITVTPTNGATPYQYAIDGGGFQAGSIFSGVASGSHNVVIKDAVGCTSASIPVTVGVGPAIVGTATPAATSCSGATDGTVSVSATNGVTPYQYSVDGGSFQSSNAFANLATGSHNVVIRDAVGCTSAPVPFTISAGSALTATAATTPTSCSGAINGTITITNTSGTGPFQYALDGINFQSSNTFTGLAQGSYTITFKNASGCSSTVQATINPGQPLTATIAVNNVLCNGGTTGNAAVNISSNGAPPYQYSLDGVTWQASNSFAGLAAGNYTAYFKDNNNCAGTRTFSVTQPAVLAASVATQAVLCNGQSNGQITATASGGTAPYQYSLNGTSWQASNIFSVAAGPYTVYVKDNNNCITTQAVSVSQPAVLTATNITSNASCDGGSDGTITINATGGSTAYQYSLNGTSFQSSNVFNTLAGNYTATIKDANGCTTTTQAVVGLTNNLTLTPLADPTICEGSNVKLQPNTNATQYAWSPSTGLSAANTAQPTAAPVVTTTYYLTATLGLCSVKDTVVVNVNPAPKPDAGVDGDICFGQTYQLQGSGGVTYQWSPSTYLDNAGIYNPTVTPDRTTQYSLHVIDANGCYSLQPDLVDVHVTPPIVITISRDTVAAIGDVFQLHASSVATNYLWTPAIGLSSDTAANPMVTIGGDVTYTVLATTAAGCKGQATVTIKVYDGPEIYVPSAFTPNGDGHNDVFKPFPVGIKRITYFKVFNRWGQEIYSTTTFNQGWNGTIAGKAQPTGTYVWMVEGITKDDKKITKQGTVTLIR